MKPCLDCGTPSQASRCPQCRKRQEASRTRPTEQRRKMYGRNHKRIAAMICATASACWVCGEGARPGDPWQADHIQQGDPDSPLAAAHRSCNIARSNRARAKK